MTKSMANPLGSRNLVRTASSSNGFTLIEMLFVLVLTISLLGGTIGLMSITSRSHKQATQNLFHRQEIRRFADDLRRDIRSADGSELIEDRLVLSYASPDRQIVYSVSSDRGARRWIEVNKGTASHPDRYRMGTFVDIDAQWLDRVHAVQFTFTDEDRPNRPIQIVASRGTAP